jgi:hypothetical protein
LTGLSFSQGQREGCNNINCWHHPVAAFDHLSRSALQLDGIIRVVGQTKCVQVVLEDGVRQERLTSDRCGTLRLECRTMSRQRAGWRSSSSLQQKLCFGWMQKHKHYRRPKQVSQQDKQSLQQEWVLLIAYLASYCCCGCCFYRAISSAADE